MKTDTQKAVGHTAGPWKASQCSKLVERDHVLGTPIAQLNPCGAIHPDESEANALLISQAPAMLEALEELTNEASDNLENVGLPHDKAMLMLALIDNARAIIARAKGEA